MKTDSLQTVSRQYRATLARTAYEIEQAAKTQRDKGALPAVIRRQSIPPRLLSKAKAYKARKLAQALAGYHLKPGRNWPLRNGRYVAPLP